MYVDIKKAKAHLAKSDYIASISELFKGFEVFDNYLEGRYQLVIALNRNYVRTAKLENKNDLLSSDLNVGELCRLDFFYKNHEIEEKKSIGIKKASLLPSNLYTKLFFVNEDCLSLYFELTEEIRSELNKLNYKTKDLSLSCVKINKIDPVTLKLFISLDYSGGDFSNFLSIYQKISSPNICGWDGILSEIRELQKNKASILGMGRFSIPDNFYLSNQLILSVSRVIHHKSIASRFNMKKEVDSQLKTQEMHIDGVKRIGDLFIIHGWSSGCEEGMLRYELYSEVNNEISSGYCSLYERKDLLLVFNSKSYKGFVFSVKIKDEKKPYSLLLQAPGYNKVRKNIQNNGKWILDEKKIPEYFGIVSSSSITKDLCDDFFIPLLQEFTKSKHKSSSNADEAKYYEFGKKVSAPLISIIIPLYGSTRFEISQIPTLAAQFGSKIEIIFGLDDPENNDLALSNIKLLAESYFICAKVVIPKSNLGFSGINNLCSVFAVSDYLLLLNSDCYIGSSDELFRSLEVAKLEELGILGYRLRYADGSVQHNGMSTGKLGQSDDFLLNLHPGISEEFIAGADFYPDKTVTMVTAACMLMSKKVFDEVGGFSTLYFKGDFEDSDLCLKVMTSGYSIGLFNSENIYHLERQSFRSIEAGLRQVITLANSRIFTKLWSMNINLGLKTLRVFS